MIEALHGIGSRLRHSALLGRQAWLWKNVEPRWQRMFERLSRRRGFATHINDDVFRLTYAFGSRYGRFDHRTYESVPYGTFVGAISAGSIVFDIGAHVGIFTLGAAKRVGPEGKVYAFEAAPETAEILQHHVFLNRAERQVLRGAKNVLLTRPVWILCEIHPDQMQYCGTSPAELNSFLREIRYRLRPIDEPNELGIFHSIITREASADST